MPFNENQKKPKTEELPKSTICICMNCEDRFGSNNGICAMFCKNCKTKEMRAKLNAENARIMAEQKSVSESPEIVADRVIREEITIKPQTT